MPASGVFPKRLRPPALTKDELLAQSAYRTPLTVSSIAKGAKDDVAKAAWAETKAEIEKGWIFLDSLVRSSSHYLVTKIWAATARQDSRDR